MAIKRYVPTIGNANWNIKTMSKEERMKIKSRLRVAIVTKEEDYQTVISYLHMKYPDLMDKNPDGMNLQWLYAPHRFKSYVSNPNVPDGKMDMYAFIYYDPARDNEPVCFGGSYFKEHPAQNGEDPRYVLEGGKRSIWGHGYVLFVDPDYRRMGIANDSWVAEAALYRDSNVRYQYDIQNEHSLKVTQNMFSDPSKCTIVAPGRLKNDGTRAGIRILMDYTDQDLIDAWDSMMPNMKEIYNKPDWTFLKREGLTREELTAPWRK